MFVRKRVHPYTPEDILDHRIGLDGNHWFPNPPLNRTSILVRRISRTRLCRAELQLFANPVVLTLIATRLQSFGEITSPLNFHSLSLEQALICDDQ